jgi:hypothetical protein
MRKNFTFKLPDEPWTTTTALNKIVDAVYTGPRYLALWIRGRDGSVAYLDRSGETMASLELEFLVDDDPDADIHVLDADVHTFEAAYITNQYEHEPIPDYEEELPNNGGTYLFRYGSLSSGISATYNSFNIFYRDGQWTEPGFIQHALSKESVMGQFSKTLADVRKSLETKEFTDEEKTKLEEYATWLSTAATVYADVDHWKIPFPTNIPGY